MSDNTTTAPVEVWPSSLYEIATVRRAGVRLGLVFARREHWIVPDERWWAQTASGRELAGGHRHRFQAVDALVEAVDAQP